MVNEMKRTGNEADESGQVDHYGASYGNLASKVSGEVRAETYGDDIGQTGWLTAREQDPFIEHLALTLDRPGQRALQ